jgi:hypothetical protein
MRLCWNIGPEETFKGLFVKEGVMVFRGLGKWDGGG